MLMNTRRKKNPRERKRAADSNYQLDKRLNTTEKVRKGRWKRLVCVGLIIHPLNLTLNNSKLKTKLIGPDLSIE